MATLAAIALAMSFVAGQSVEESSAKKRNEAIMAEKLSALSGERDALRLETATAKQAQIEAKATVVALRDKLKSTTSMKATDDADLRLYRRIANLDDTEARGLFVDAVTMSKNFETDEVSLNILLIQTEGRNRIRGSVGATILPDTGKPISIVDSGDEKAPDFNLRFFQTVHIPVPKTKGVMDELEIHVKPTEKSHKAFTHRIPWKEIERLR
ncbi:MAG: DUF6776 family protein [Granulosicoccaceae bacterium]